MATRSKKQYQGKKKNNDRDRPKKSAGFRGEKGKGGKSTKKPQPKKKKPKYPSIKQYLGSDRYYQNTISDLLRNQEMFNEQNMFAQGDLQQNFDMTMENMGIERERALKDIKDDFGGRNLVTSGLYGNSVSEYNDDYSRQASQLNMDLTSQLRNMDFEKQNMQNLTDSQKKDARLDAIRRRAEEIGARTYSRGGGGNPKPKTGGKQTNVKQQPTRKANAGPKRAAANKRAYKGR